MAFTEKHLSSLIKAAVENDASDIHIREGEPPCFRITGDLVPVQTKKFTNENIIDIMRIFLGDSPAAKSLSKQNELDGGYTIDGFCRLRYNFFRYQANIGIICRIIKEKIPTIEQLGLPSVLKTIAERQRGMILVTGATGSGKSTTLAAMIDYINSSRPCHIITIEDPVEYLHPQKTARITQREVGLDTIDYTIGLRSAMRQDPDVILIGELRDAETISTALKASETGHVVFATVHTTDATKTIGRIIAMFSSEEQNEVRKRLSENLYSTISQRMLKSKNDTRVVATEIMISTPGIKDCISGKDSLNRINEIIRKGRGKEGNGSRSFDQHIMALYKKKTHFQNNRSRSGHF